MSEFEHKLQTFYGKEILVRKLCSIFTADRDYIKVEPFSTLEAAIEFILT